jgi:hypothetical protein
MHPKMQFHALFNLPDAATLKRGDDIRQVVEYDIGTPVGLSALGSRIK